MMLLLLARLGADVAVLNVRVVGTRFVLVVILAHDAPAVTQVKTITNAEPAADNGQ